MPAAKPNAVPILNRVTLFLLQAYEQRDSNS